VTDTIILDTTPPTGSVSINNGQVYTNALPAQLTLTATDNLSLTQMNVYAEGVWLGWVSYAPSQVITLSSGDGVKVYGAQFKDAAGNLSAFYTDTIILDTTPPTASLALNAGAVYAQASPVTANLVAADNTSLTLMQYQVDGALQSWEPIAGAKQIALAGDGTHTVTVRAQDGAGNVSAYYTDTIILDTTPPTGTILVNNGATYANTTTLTLTLSATDNYTVAQIRFYYDGFWHPLVPYSTSATIVVTSGNTSPAINVQFVDGAGNGNTNAIYDGILIDVNPPSGSILLSGGAVYATGSQVNITNSTFFSNSAQGNGGAIYDDQRFVRTIRRAVNLFGQLFFARACFTEDQDVHPWG
jgi:predicted outer membrane repeat protein